MIIPMLLFSIPIILKNYYGPYYLGYNSDPDYAYLLNSLNILNLIPPGHTDHPGTTVHVIGAIGLLIKWFCHLVTGGKLGLNDFVLKNPEESLKAINYLINVLIFGGIVFSSLCVYRAMQNVFSVMIFQLTLLVPLQIKISLFRVDPEPLLVFSVVILSGLIFVFQKAHSEAHYKSSLPVFIGAMIGFGLATKITFIPMLMFVFIFITKRERLMAATASLISFIFFTLPIITKFPKMFSWFWSLAIHEEEYGHGDIGIPSITELLNNLIELINNEPYLFIFLICYVLYLLFLKYVAKQTDSNINYRLLKLGVYIIVMQCAMAIKHPGVHAGVRYMVPAITLMAFLNVQMICSLKHLASSSFLIRYIYCVVIFIGVIYGFYSLKTWAFTSSEYYKSEIELLSRMNKMNGCSVIQNYRASSIEYAFAFGNMHSGSSFSEQLEKMYPKVYFYNMWTGGFDTYNKKYNDSYVFNLLHENRCQLIYGMPMEERDINAFLLTPISVTSQIALYKIGLEP